MDSAPSKHCVGRHRALCRCEPFHWNPGSHSSANSLLQASCFGRIVSQQAQVALHHGSKCAICFSWPAGCECDTRCLRGAEPRIAAVRTTLLMPSSFLLQLAMLLDLQDFVGRMDRHCGVISFSNPASILAAGTPETSTLSVRTVQITVAALCNVARSGLACDMTFSAKLSAVFNAGYRPSRFDRQPPSGLLRSMAVYMY